MTRFLPRLALAVPSRIGLRIFAFNLLVLFLPVGGILYLDVYERELLATQERGMVQQARIVAEGLSGARESFQGRPRRGSSVSRCRPTRGSASSRRTAAWWPTPPRGGSRPWSRRSRPMPAPLTAARPGCIAPGPGSRSGSGEWPTAAGRSCAVLIRFATRRRAGRRPRCGPRWPGSTGRPRARRQASARSRSTARCRSATATASRAPSWCRSRPIASCRRSTACGCGSSRWWSRPSCWRRCSAR
ncbi:MAG: sensor N-terminal transmembrane domain-containing protein [Acidobacteria bacterium]|nr:sensor N-terminal transmembrane domain-containing protein [Acidobacteriota bacterium]